jgi:predicted metalloprotease with PDZ domain
MGDVMIKSLDVGGQMAEDIPAIVMDHPTVEAVGKIIGDPIHGLIGFPFFGRYKLTLDYKAKAMTLEPNGYKPPDVMKLMMAAMLAGTAPKVLAPSAQFGLNATKEAGDKDDGVDVTGVLPGGPAEKAGVKRGDRLLTLDGRWTDTMADLYEAAGHAKPGAAVILKVKRGEKELELKVTPLKGF